MVVTKLNREFGLPLSESDSTDKFPVRKKERAGDAGVSVRVLGAKFERWVAGRDDDVEKGAGAMVVVKFERWVPGRDEIVARSVLMEIVRVGGGISGRRRGLVEGVFCSLERRFCCFARTGASCGEVLGAKKRERGRMGDRGRNGWLVSVCVCAVGVPDGECSGKGRVLVMTYSFFPSCFASSSFARSSSCTATLKRFQKWGSRIILRVCCLDIQGRLVVGGEGGRREVARRSWFLLTEDLRR